MYPHLRGPANQYLHAQTVTTRRGCGCSGMHEAPRELSAHRGIGIASGEVERKVSREARGVERVGGERGWGGGAGRGVPAARGEGAGYAGAGWGGGVWGVEAGDCWGVERGFHEVTYVLYHIVPVLMS